MRTVRTGWSERVQFVVWTDQGETIRAKEEKRRKHGWKTTYEEAEYGRVAQCRPSIEEAWIWEGSDPSPIPGRLSKKKSSWYELEQKEGVKLSKIVRQILEEGAPLLFGGKRPRTKHMEVCHIDGADMRRAMEEFVAEGLGQGSVERVIEKPEVISPVFVIPKRTPGKYRVIIDLRYVNSFMEVPKFREEDMSSVSSQVKQGDWMTTIDIENGFHHLSVREKERTFLGFKWRGRYYRFAAMPFGSAASPYLFNKALRPIVTWMRKCGIRLNKFVDDFLIMAETEEQARADTQLAVQILKRFGWSVNFEKSELTPAQEVEYLGLIIKTAAGEKPTLHVPAEKRRKLRYNIKRVLSHKSWTKRRIAAVVGMANAVSRAVPAVEMFMRPLIRCMNQARDWKDPVRVTAVARSYLRRFLEALQHWDGRATSMRPPDLHMTTDASNFAWGAALQDWEAAGTWSREDADKHINFKELKTVLFALQALPAELWKGKHLRIHSDNTVTVAYVNRLTGRSPELAVLAEEIFVLAKERQADVSAVHIKGEHNCRADRLSRQRERHGWQMDTTKFNKVAERWLTPTIDRFADNINARLPRFNSRWWTPGAEDYDALRLNWRNEVNYVCPPIRLLGPCISKIRREAATAIVIAPLWEAQPWFQELVSMSKDRLMIPNTAFVNPHSTATPEPQRNSRWKFAAFWVPGGGAYRA